MALYAEQPTTSLIAKTKIDGRSKGTFATRLFGARFPLLVEPHVFSFADRLCPDYSGGNWDFFSLSNGSFFMSPDMPGPVRVESPNGHTADLSPEALGLVACLFALGTLAARPEGAFAERCAEHYYLLLDFVDGHPEHLAIRRLID